ncbi:B18 subunit of NADH:ubiquinone oxidoreductase [Lentinula aciculospora]|uniref:NADH dehydrogenase [ubiquinone] 1 beta subcomplex subunit 7 n=1 Tax=Lentinula aciculospora TaxID=153920 RepID=A0A9W9DWQ4_9AGAR|nr:B18 subunit of NADH:ubiquinone oxidoreductase [Lentinula aciculospora]
MSSSSTIATREEMKAAKLPLGWRDQCSALLIPLNICRKEKHFLPWECEHERHVYEKCQYDDYMRRMAELSRRKKAEL